MNSQIKKPYGFIAYVDESGDDGLKRVRPTHPEGSSEWLVLSAVVVRRGNEGAVGRWQKEMREGLKLTQRPDIHYRDLSPPKREYVCKQLATKDVRLFVVMSHKVNMVGYRNPRVRREGKSFFYWWLTRLLFERVTAFCAKKSAQIYGEPRPIKIMFSQRGGMDYSQLASYWEVLQLREKPVLSADNLRWEVIDTHHVHAVHHKGEAGLQLADIVAGAFFQAVTIDGQRMCDPKFACLLEPRMYRGAKGRILGMGVKYMPQLPKMNLRDEQKQLFMAYGASDEWWGGRRPAP